MFKQKPLTTTGVLTDFNSSTVSFRNCDKGAWQFNITNTTPTTFTFVDGDVNTTNDTIAETAHGISTGTKVVLSTTGVLPGGLSATTYYVIASSANLIKLATSYVLAIAGTAVDITSAAGGGTHTVTVSTLSGTIKLQASLDDGTNWADITGASTAVTDSTVVLYNLTDIGYADVRAAWSHTAGMCSIDGYATGKERDEK